MVLNRVFARAFIKSCNKIQRTLCFSSKRAYILKFCSDFLENFKQIIFLYGYGSFFTRLPMKIGEVSE